MYVQNLLLAIEMKSGCRDVEAMHKCIEDDDTELASDN